LAIKCNAQLASPIYCKKSQQKGNEHE